MDNRKIKILETNDSLCIQIGDTIVPLDSCIKYEIRRSGGKHCKELVLIFNPEELEVNINLDEKN